MNKPLKWPIRPNRITHSVTDGEIGIISQSYISGLLYELSLETNLHLTFLEYGIKKHSYNLKYINFDQLSHDNTCLASECKNCECFYNDLIDFYTSTSPDNSLSLEEFEYKFVSIFSKMPNKVRIGDVVSYTYDCFKLIKEDEFVVEYALPIILEDVLLGFIFISNPNCKIISTDPGFESSIRSIASIHDILTKELLQLRESFVLNSINTINMKLIDSTSLELKPSSDKDFYNGKIDPSSFWKNITDTINDLLSYFPAEHIVLFASEDYNFHSIKLKPIVSCGVPLSKLKNAWFDADNIPEFPKNEPSITSHSHLELIDQFHSKDYPIHPSNDLIRVFKNPFGNRNIFVVWIRYNSNWDRVKELNTKNEFRTSEDKVFDSGIRSFYSLLSSLYSTIILENYSDILNNNIIITYHELAQYTSAIDGLRFNYLENNKILDPLNQYKYVHNLNNDLKDNIQQMYQFLQNNKSIVKYDTINSYDTFDPVTEVVLKWVHSLKIKATAKKSTIIYPNLSSTKIIDLVTDKPKYEQIFFNVLNNAIKYSHRGTKIEISYEQDDKYFNLKITDYGNKVSNQLQDSRIFDLFVRGFSRNNDGLGVGLYISNLNINTLKGKISYEQQKLSEYHIPILVYLFDEAIDKDSFCKKYLTDEISVEQFKKTIINYLGTGKQSYIPFGDSKSILLTHSTYRVTFTISVPIKSP